MKVLSTEGLTKLIQLIKSSFISTSNTVTTNTVTLADVATSGDFDDLTNKPTIPSAISDLTDNTSTNPIDKAKSVEDQRDSSSLKYWTGTKAQYDEIATKDNDTIYNVEDTTSPIVDILNTLYPIGAIYIGTMATCPLSVLGVGTWQLVAQDRVLQGAGTRGAVGTTINESLPNIKTRGWDAYGYGTRSAGTSEGITIGTVNNSTGTLGGSGGHHCIYNLDASSANSTYQDNAPVQQDGYLVNIWERIS